MTIASSLANLTAPPEPELQRVITVRLPKSMHERLKEVAYEQRTSLNVLCLASLDAALKELEGKA